LDEKLEKLDAKCLLRSVIIRRATVSDAVPFLKLEAECFEMKFVDAALYYWRPIIDYCYAFKAVFERKIVGGIIAIPTRQGQIYINSLFVQGNFRNLGIATSLLKRISSITCEKGFILDVKTKKEYLISFYKKRGFKAIRRESNYYLDGTTRIIMKRPSNFKD